MRLPRTILLCLLLASGLAATPSWAENGDTPAPKAKPGDAPAGGVRPGSLQHLGLRMQKLAQRITEIVKEASRDPDALLIDIYLAYSPKELKNKRRQVRAEDLVRIMVDPNNALPLRERAQKAVQDGSLRGDIELSPTNKKRGMTERAWFCRSDVIEHLKHDDKDARRLTNELLRRWYRVNTVPAILGYKVGDKKTWSRAHSAWNKELKRR